jgi:hypothetical protein
MGRLLSRERMPRGAPSVECICVTGASARVTIDEIETLVARVVFSLGWEQDRLMAESAD